MLWMIDNGIHDLLGTVRINCPVHVPFGTVEFAGLPCGC